MQSGNPPSKSSAPYAITESLSHGTRSTVYRAIRNADGCPVVLKVLVPQRSGPKDVERLKNEFEIGRVLDSAAILKPLALETYQGMPALVFEDFAGRSLGDLIGTPMPLERFLPLTIAIAKAVAKIHQAGFVHKDLKPDNILVSPASFQVKLADLELACRVQPVATPPRLIEGSLPYLSPEQTGRMNRAIDHRSDLYALGVTFFQVLTGKLPFEANDPVEWVYCHVARTPPSPSELVPGVPEPLARVVLKLLAKMPEDRYQSAVGLVADLERCLTQWQACGRVDPFRLGQDDIWDRLQIPQQLYGRERETAALLSAFDAVATTGTPALVMVSGYSGVGKSTLVNALHKPIVEKRGYFIAGKFDQYKRDIPYATPAQAFRGLIRQILGESEARINEWRDTLREALGPYGQLMVNLIPELELVIGPQQPAPELPLQQAHYRFQMVFRQLIGVFAQAAHPLVLFLDDLQWLDAGTLALLADLATHPDVRHLFLVGAYRDNEVDASHSLTRSLAEIRKAGRSVHEIVLTTLSQDDVGRLVADALHDRPERVRPLSELVFEKTHGNPFFTIQFLTALAEEKLLAFDLGTRAFRWDVRRIHAKGYTDNVVDLVAGRMDRLTAACRNTLQTLACLGIRAEDSVLSRVLGGAEDKLGGSLREAVRAGLLLRQESGYAFVHDRIREAAYASIAPPKRSGEHVRLGRLLLAGRTAEEVGDDEVFELVNQFNRGLALLADAGERDLVRRLNLRAGRRSKAAIAYAAAREYLAQANALLPQDAWTLDYAEAFATGFELAECAYLVGHFEEADARFREIFEKARTTFDRAKALNLRVRLYHGSARVWDALDTGLAALRLLGFPIRDAEEDIWKAVAAEKAQIPALLGGRRIADLALAQEVSDRRVRASLDLIADTLTLALLVKPALYPWLAIRGLTLSLRHGNTAASCHAYIAYAALLVGYRDIPSAQAFSDLSLELNARFRDVTQKAAVLCGRGGVVGPWSRPLPACKAILEQGIEASLQAGDYPYLLYSATLALWFDVESAESIAVARNNCKKYRALADRIHNDLYSLTFRLFEQFFLCLQGLTVSPPSFEDGGFQEGDLEAFRKVNFAIGLYYSHDLKLLTAFTFGKFEQALEHADKARELQGKLPLMFLCNATHVFYHALTLTALSPQVPSERQAEFAQRLEELLAQLEYWADTCPENFRNRHALVAAEKARLEGQDLDAMRLYEQAIRSARDNGFVYHEALANELAGHFYLGCGLEKNAFTHLRDARTCYARWGADGKVKQLEQHYPRLVEASLLAPTSTVAMRTEQLDLTSVTKASQTISGEIILDDLLRTLLTIVLEQGGAERGCFVLYRDGRLSIEAEATLDAKGVVTTVLDRAPVEGSPRIPASVVHYAHRTKERVILNYDEGAAGEFAGDDYFAAHRPKSVLCLPIRRQAEVVGLLYLENDLLVGAFTFDRLAALELLATQAAISLENALLLAKVKAALADAAFLADAGAVLSESLDYEKTFARLGRLCVRGLSDWCTIDIVEGQEIRRLAVAHRDPTKEPMLLEVQKRYPLRWDSPHPAAVALRTGEPVLTPEVTEEHARAICHDQEHLRLVRALGLRTAISVPLIARGQTLGVLSLACDAPGRRYGPADLELAQDLGRRAAVAIDNSRLYQASQEELRLRKAVEAQLVQAQKMESIGRLAGGIAHDFNNFLTAISLGIELSVSELPADHPVRKHLADVFDAAGSAAGLTRQLLAFSRKQIIAPRVLDLNEVIVRVEKMILRLLGEDIKLATVCAPNLMSVSFDPGQVEQILVNLAVNARDAMPEGGRLTIQTSNIYVDEEYARLHVDAQPGPHVLLQISDTGLGMNADVRARLFEPFFTTKEPGKGTGLGLAIVYGAVRQNGGRIEVYSELGIGTTFKIYLPAASGAPLTAPPRVSVSTPARAVSILLVEDDKRVRTFATSVLTRFGHTIHAFANGEDALAALSTLHPTPELLITDVIMPGMNGRVLADHLAERLPNIRVLFVSGYPDNVIVHHGILKKGIEFLAKPFSIEQLTRRVSEVLDSSLRPSRPPQ